MHSHILHLIDRVCSLTVRLGVNKNTEHKIRSTKVEVFCIQYSYFARTSLYTADIKIMNLV